MSSLAELRKAILAAKQRQQVKEKKKEEKKEPPKEEKLFVGHEELLKEKPKKEVRKAEVGAEKNPRPQLTSDQLRAIYLIMFGKTSRKSNKEIAMEIVQFLREAFNLP